MFILIEGSICSINFNEIKNLELVLIKQGKAHQPLLYINISKYNRLFSQWNQYIQNKLMKYKLYPGQSLVPHLTMYVHFHITNTQSLRWGTATQKIHCIFLVSLPPALLPLRKGHMKPVFNCSTLVFCKNYVVMTDSRYLNQPADCQKSTCEEAWFVFRTNDQKMERMQRPSTLYFSPQHNRSSASNFIPNVTINIIC